MLGKAVVAAVERAVAFQDMEVGEPGPWDLLVELEASAISVGTECYTLANFVRRGLSGPIVLGYAPVGRVIATGAAVGDTFPVGSRVSYFQPSPAPGLASHCGGHQSPALVNVDPSSRDLLDPNTYVVTVPEELASERAAFAGISAVSSLGVSLVKPAVGERALVVGGGMIGQFAAQHLKLRGAEVAVADLHDARLRGAAQSGADHTINISGTNLGDAIARIWPHGADLVADCTGNYTAIEAALQALRLRGRFLFLGWCKGKGFDLELLQGGRVFEAYFPWTLEGRHAVSSMRLLASGALQVDHLITHRFAAADVRAAFDLAFGEPHRYTGILLQWDAG